MVIVEILLVRSSQTMQYLGHALGKPTVDWLCAVVNKREMWTNQNSRLAWRANDHTFTRAIHWESAIPDYLIPDISMDRHSDTEQQPDYPGILSTNGVPGYRSPR